MANSLNLDQQKLNATMRKFGAPASVIRQYERWTVLLRPAQATLGALVLAANSDAEQFAALAPEYFSDLAAVTADIERVLRQRFEYQKLNYLMLMMVDPQVHFHVLPRYAQEQQFDGHTFVDAGWPGPPELGQTNDADGPLLDKLCSRLRQDWP